MPSPPPGGKEAEYGGPYWWEAVPRIRRRQQERRQGKEDSGSTLALAPPPPACVQRTALVAWARGAAGAAPMGGAPTWACPLCIELLGQQAARVAAEGWQGCAAARERNAQARRVEQARPGAPTRRSSADRGCQRRREAEETKGAGAPEKHRSGCHVQRGAGSSSAAPGRARAGTMRPGGNAGVKAPLEPKWLEPKWPRLVSLN